jgi:uncharacterized protein RhaS with RHS repeats
MGSFRIMRGAGRTAAAAAAAALGAAAGLAAETIAYGYDARGRLVKVERTGTVNNGVATAYTLDKADNRISKTTTGSPNPPPP